MSLPSHICIRSQLAENTSEKDPCLGLVVCPVLNKRKGHSIFERNGTLDKKKDSLCLPSQFSPVLRDGKDM